MYIDFTYLNKHYPKDFYSLLAIDQKIESMVDYRVLSFLDLYKGHHQVPMDKDDTSKTTFITNWGKFTYKKKCLLDQKLKCRNDLSMVGRSCVPMTN